MALAAHGWRVFPLRPRDKRPLPGFTSWQDQATTDEDQIGEWWESTPLANVAVVMGPSSGIVDIETDDDDAEQFLLTRLFEGQEIVTPTFQSAKGRHRLFRFTHELPTKANFRLDQSIAIDFKVGAAGGSYSVFPPSVHPDGPSYNWLLHPDDIDVAELPDVVIARIHSYLAEGVGQVGEHARKPQEHWDKILRGVGEGSRNADAASLIGHLVAGQDVNDKQRLAVLWELVKNWNRQNRPPLGDHELETTFRSIVEREQRQSVSRHFVPPAADPPAQPEKDAPPPGWHLTRVNADPPYYKLRSPKWDGDVILSDDDLLSAHRIRREVQKQKCVGLNAAFRKWWDGGKGDKSVYELLMENITQEDARFDERRENRLAERIANRLSDAMEDEHPNRYGTPTMIGRDVWFRLDNLIMEDRVLADHERDVVRLLHQHGIVERKDRRRVIDGVSRRYKVVTPKGMDALRRLADYDTESER